MTPNDKEQKLYNFQMGVLDAVARLLGMIAVDENKLVITITVSRNSLESGDFKTEVSFPKSLDRYSGTANG